MCRLAYIPANTKLSTEELSLFFNQLEKSFGGDGNGFAAVSPTGGVVINKAVKLDCNDIASEVQGLLENGWAIYFHTRKTSIGFTTDEQCHPFRIKGESWIGSLCHNGTWQDGGILAKYLGTGSDTAAMAHLIGELGVEEIEKRKLMPRSGVFLLYGNKPGDSPSHTVMKIGGSLAYCPKTKIWASEFFKDWPYYDETYEVKTGTWNLNGDAPEKSFVTSYNYSNYNYNSNRSSSYNYSRNSASGSTTSNINNSMVSSQDESDLESIFKAGAKASDDEIYGDRQWYHTQM